jgi:hypothetical protein
MRVNCSYISSIDIFTQNIQKSILKWDFNVGNQLDTSSKYLVAKVKKIGSQRYKVKRVKTNILPMI